MERVVKTLREGATWESENHLTFVAEKVVRQTLEAAESRISLVCGKELQGVVKTANLLHLID